MDIIDNNKVIFVVIIIVVIALIYDTSLKVSNFTTSQSGSLQRVYSFIVIISIILVGQYLILGFVRDKSKVIRGKKVLRIDVINKIVTIVQYVLTVILVLVTMEIVLT
jgi:hypothetical protein